MPQLPTRAQDPKKLISAGMPKNISAADRAALEEKWNEAARKRAEAVERETRIPSKASVILKYELHKFGHHWQSFSVDRRGRRVPLIPTPSLLTSAMDAISDCMADEGVRA